MANGVNKVILIGNLGSDPDVRYTQGGVTVANVSLATNESWVDKNTGQKQEKIEWHRLVFFNKLADVVATFLKKGAKIYVEGKIQGQKWMDKNGVDRYTTQIVCHSMLMLSSKGKEEQGTHEAPISEEEAQAAVSRTLGEEGWRGKLEQLEEIPF